MTDVASTLDDLLREDRRFDPPEEFRRQANVTDEAIYRSAADDPEGYWAGWAGTLDWIRPWDRVLEWEPPHARWFVGGKLNVAHNCVDRHVQGPRRNKAALVWEGEPGDRQTYTYGDLARDVAKLGNSLRALGIGKGDRVAIYLPMIPEAVIAMLACARIGAVHSVVFGGFSPDSLAARINDAGARLLITADGGYRRGDVVPLKRNADRALEQCSTVENVIVVARGWQITRTTRSPMNPARDHWYHELMADASAAGDPEPMDAEDPLFILYTSGTTGSPKGILHTNGGYLTHVAATSRWVFDLKDDDVYWCTADVGWITGHSYIVYGPLAEGATAVIYEGAPDFPERDRMWELCAKYGVSVFYTAPTAIRAFMRWGDEWPARHDLSRLRLLGTVGEPINPEAWMWYRDRIGGGRCPVVDTWWQTETGGIMIAPLPGITPTRPGSATRPFPGIEPDVLDDEGRPTSSGYLGIKKPWPGMARTVYGDDERYRETYWSKWDGIYFPGDGAKRGEDGYFWILGRVDDVLNVAGHRIGTMEVESTLVEHPDIVEAAVVGRADDVKGQAIAAFVTPREGREASGELRDELRAHVADRIGPIARPADVLFSAELPKTRSGKIMRRLLRDIAEGRALGDVTTLADPTVVERLKSRYEESGGED